MEKEIIKRLEMAKKISSEESFRNHGYDKLLSRLKRPSMTIQDIIKQKRPSMTIQDIIKQKRLLEEEK